MRSYKEKERWQGKRIVNKAEFIWGWGTKAGKERVKRRVGLLVGLGEIYEGKHVLEIGCGIGIFTSKIAQTKARIMAIDISEDLINRAKKEVNFPNVNFQVADVEKLPFPKLTFDVVYGCSTLHHLNLGSGFQEICRVLKKNGRIVFSEPNMLSPLVMIQKNVLPIKILSGDIPGETAFFRWSLKHFLENRGFTHVKIQCFDFLFPWTPPVLILGVKGTGSFLEKIPFIREIAGSLIISGEFSNLK